MFLRSLNVVFASSISLCVADLASTPLAEWPMLLAHDSASAYLLSKVNPLSAWIRTQQPSSTAFTHQLDCGARAIDMRYAVDKKGKMVFHHGSMNIDHDVNAALQEVVSWANQHPNVEDLVVIYPSHCAGANCGSALQEALDKAGLVTVSDCSQVANLTLGSAAELGKLPGGGQVLVLKDCVDENWNEELTCTGFGKKSEEEHEVEKLCGPGPWNHQQLIDCGTQLLNKTDVSSVTYSCWKGSSTRDYPVNRLLDYLKSVSNKEARPGRLQEMQCLWQESVASIVLGVLHASSLLKDEHKSGLNAMAKDLIDKDTFKTISLFEINQVCDGGPELHASLKALAERRARERDTKKELLVV